MVDCQRLFLETKTNCHSTCTLIDTLEKVVIIKRNDEAIFLGGDLCDKRLLPRKFGASCRLKKASRNHDFFYNIIAQNHKP